MEDLKTNMLVGTDIMTPGHLVLDLKQETAFIGSCSCAFNIDIETPRRSV